MESKQIDLNEKTKEQVEALSELLGKEVARIMDEANTKCNNLLRNYGLQTEIGYNITKINNN
jgi:hypothetical protein